MRNILTAAVGFVLVAASPPAVAFNALTSFDFETAGSTEGWSPVNATLATAGGVLSGTVTATDPQIVLLGTGFSGNASSGLLVRYRGGKNGNVELFWGNSAANSFSSGRRITVTYSGGGAWQTLFLCPRGHVDWDDKTITRLRVDPVGATNDTFQIDWLRVLAWDYDNDGWRDDVEGAADTDGDGLMNLEDLDSDNNGLSDAWEKAILNAPGSVHFNFDNNQEGWTGGGGLSLQGVTAGTWVGQVTGADPQLVRDRLHLWAGLIDGLIVRIENPAAGSMTLFWSHDGAGGFSATRSMTLAVPSGPAGPRTVYFDMRSANEWKGKLITGLRIDTDFPLNTVFSIDSIRTSDGDYDRDGLSDTQEGTIDTDGDGISNFMDTDSDGDGVSDTEETRRGWNVLSPLDATRDSDGDGTSDAAESVAGTDPMNANDRLQSSIQATGTGYDVMVGARAGRSYAMQRSADLSSWNSYGTVPQVSGSPLLTWPVDDPAPGREFYRFGISAPMEAPNPAGGNSPTAGVGSTETAWLDNGTLRLGAPVNNGASFNFLAPSGSGNLVNYHDRGRLIQQSYYAGLGLDRTGSGQSASWSPWPWNPIQGGDASGKPAQVVEVGSAEFGNAFFTRTIPLLWDMTTGEKAKAWMDQWNEFEPGMPDVVRVTCRLSCFRDPDDIWGAAVSRHQELPATYFIRNLSKAVTYLGESPWTNDATEEVETYFPGASFPWGRYTPKEAWVAMVDPVTDIGVGLYSPIGVTWNVGAVGLPPGGPTSSATMHMAPVRGMKLDRDSIMVYRYWIIHGSLATIRSRVYELHGLHPGG